MADQVIIPPQVGIEIVTAEGVTISVGARVLGARSAITERVGRVAGYWAHAEAELTSYLSVLMDTTPERTFALVGAYRSASATAEGAKNLARATLEGADLAQAEALISRFKALAQERNKLQHGVWGSRSDRSDSLFLIKGAEYAKFTVIFASKVTPEEQIAYGLSFGAQFTDEYTVDRLNELVEQILALTRDISSTAIVWIRNRLLNT